jgi:hypothetical protein
VPPDNEPDQERMTGRNGASGDNLTGVWHGTFSYPRDQGPVAFVATLIESGRFVSGTTHELCAVGGNPNDTLYASLAGSRAGSAVAFIKTYDGANPNYRSVDYEGTLSSDGTEIEGRWVIHGVWSGKFLMIRSAGKAETVERKVTERARS